MNLPDPFVLMTAHDRVSSLVGISKGLRSSAALVTLLETLRKRGAADPAELAAQCASGLVVARPFAAGNELTAMIAMESCLELNGWDLSADDLQLALAGIRLSAGELPERELLTWLRGVARPHTGCK